MSFEAKMADHLLTLKQSRNKLLDERMSMAHECDCEYCDYDGLGDDYTQEDMDAMDRRIEEIDATIRGLKGHAQIHGIDL